MPPRDPRQPADFDPVILGKHLLRTIRVGALGTLDPDTGFPVVTLTSVATDYDGTPIIFVSRLSQHTKNLLADPRASLLLSQGGKGDPLAHPRLTLMVMAEQSTAPHLRERFLGRHPKAQLYIDFPDFLFFRLAAQKVHLNGGFARAFDGDAALLMTDVEDVETFADLATSAIEHMNTDHVEALALYAAALCDMPKGKWRASGLDPEGFDLALGDQTARVAFPAPVRDAAGLRQTLKLLADEGRSTV
ncbi:MAG: pyridoxamine 5'-phosphate oxidase [Rhizobiales bacterium PAR1]|nr:MAG: pyridoxamine 5'-phosphate oxidase [Rhizobiales bacterium PAR1]